MPQVDDIPKEGKHMQGKRIRGMVPAPRKVLRQWNWPRSLTWLPSLGHDGVAPRWAH